MCRQDSPVHHLLCHFLGSVCHFRMTAPPSQTTQYASSPQATAVLLHRDQITNQPIEITPLTAATCIRQHLGQASCCSDSSPTPGGVNLRILNVIHDPSMRLLEISPASHVFWPRCKHTPAHEVAPAMLATSPQRNMMRAAQRNKLVHGCSISSAGAAHPWLLPRASF